MTIEIFSRLLCACHTKHRCDFSAIGDLEFLENSLRVVFYRKRADFQCFGYFRIGFPLNKPR